MPDAQIPAVAAPDTAAARAAGRAGWMDSLRVAVIAGVIVLHAATAYILDIDWYYQERTTSTLTPALLAGLFGLGPLFLVGGCCRPPRWPARALVGSPGAAWSTWGCPCWGWWS